MSYTPPPPSDAQRVRIDGWKAIADRFQVNVRTVQLWEKQRALPVHRLPGGRSGKVFAYEDELAAWMEGGDALAAERGEPSGLKRVLITRRAFLLPLAGAAMVSPFIFRSRKTACSRVTVMDDTIHGLNAHGDTLWTYPSPYPSVSLGGRQAPWRSRLVDLDGSGTERVLIAPQPDSDRMFSNDVLLCLSTTGTLLWKLNSDPGLLDFDGSPFGTGWSFRHIVATTGTIWAAVIHSVRWASCVLKISPDGRTAVHFANHGQCQALAVGPNGQSLFIAGVNNAFDRTCVAWIGTNDPPSTSPDGGPPRYRYSNGPAGNVRRYVLIPPTEFNVHFAVRNYAHIERIQAGADGVTVSTEEAHEPFVEMLYEFSPALDPYLARTTASVQNGHQRLQQSGFVNHPWDACPLVRGPLKLQVWDPQGKWCEREIHIASRENTVSRESVTP